MPLIYWDGPNFGDRLNETLLQPELEQRGANLSKPIVGIGTILDNRRLTGDPGIVCGAGVGHGPLPRNLADWEMGLIRGPITAAAVRSKAAQGDPGFLVAAEPTGSSGGVFMPHLHTLTRFGARTLERASGLTVVDPRGDPADVLATLAGATTIAAEAMHGAIAAEALRVPWAPVRWNRHEPVTKWMDAFLPLGRAYDPTGVADRPQPVGGRRVTRRQSKRLPRLDGLDYQLSSDASLAKLQRAIHKGLDKTAELSQSA